MSRRGWPWLTIAIALLLLVAHTGLAAASTTVLAVGGMT
jgi:hypothetical protein